MIIKPRSGPAPHTAYYNYYRNHIIVVIHGPKSLFSIGAPRSPAAWAEVSGPRPPYTTFIDNESINLIVFVIITSSVRPFYFIIDRGGGGGRFRFWFVSI